MERGTVAGTKEKLVQQTEMVPRADHRDRNIGTKKAVRKKF